MISVLVLLTAPEIFKRPRSGRRHTCASHRIATASVAKFTFPCSDYRGLKKRITAIRKTQQGLSFHVSDSDSPIDSGPLPGTPRPSTIGSNSRGPSTSSEKSIKDENASKQNQNSQSAMMVDKTRPSLSVQREKKSFRAKLPSLKLTKNSRRECLINGFDSQLNVLV